jgi:hypothetical protein
VIGDDQRPVVVEFGGVPIEPHPEQHFQDRSKHRFEKAPIGSGSTHIDLGSIAGITTIPGAISPVLDLMAAKSVLVGPARRRPGPEYVT